MNVILIPSLEPNEKFIDFTTRLKQKSKLDIVVINDGSDTSYDHIFYTIEQLGITVLKHDINLGKGAALKTGIDYIRKSYNDITGIVTCDADGQHLIPDIIRVSNHLYSNKEQLVLGSRTFDNTTPLRSKLGNSFSSVYFKLSTGISIKDTQTGLRGIPKNLFELSLAIEENRFDYEMNFLLQAVKIKKVIEITITTVYEDNNSSSHFNPIVDSYKIYKKPIKYLFVALTSALIDLFIFTIISTSINTLVAYTVLIASIIARIISGLYNFLMNKYFSFESTGCIKKQFVSYFILYITQLFSSIGLVVLLSVLSIHLTLVKLFVDLNLFIISYFIQKRYIFK